ncbi:hypothetical protein GCM10028816_02670 [Spirosoma lituiforme]
MGMNQCPMAKRFFFKLPVEHVRACSLHVININGWFHGQTGPDEWILGGQRVRIRLPVGAYCIFVGYARMLSPAKSGSAPLLFGLPYVQKAAVGLQGHANAFHNPIQCIAWGMTR